MKAEGEEEGGREEEEEEEWMEGGGVLDLWRRGMRSEGRRRGRRK